MCNNNDLKSRQNIEYRFQCYEKQIREKTIFNRHLDEKYINT